MAETKIRDRLPWIVDRLFELAEGVAVVRRDNHGRERVYQQPPDRQACEYLMDRIMGKPTQTVDLRLREQAARLAEELGCSADELIREAELIAAEASTRA